MCHQEIRKGSTRYGEEGVEGYLNVLVKSPHFSGYLKYLNILFFSGKIRERYMTLF